MASLRQATGQVDSAVIVTLLTDLPTWLLGALMIGGWVVLTVAFTLFARPRLKTLAKEGHNDIVGFIFAAIGVLYGVLLGFVVSDVWGNFDTAERSTAQESSILLATYQDAYAFPEPVRQIAQERLLAYAHAVVDDEWSTMANGEASPRAAHALQALFRDYRNLKPSTSWQTSMYAESFTRLNDLTEARALRIVSSNAGLPGVFWLLLIFGGLLTSAFGGLFYIEHVRVQVGLAAALAALLAATLFLILVLDHPFAGSVHVTPDNFVQAISSMTGS